ncbi:MAG: glycosyltransferase, partial [Staphylococcus equorum]|nr:glycosyltransferase [Staphylococcus equorum]
MKLLFVHGAERLKEDNDGNFYTDGSYTQEVWNRYLSISKRLTVIFRKEHKIYDPDYAKERFQLFDKSKINYVEIPDVTSSYASFFSFKTRLEINKIIEKAVLECDYLIARLPSSAGYAAIQYAKKYKKPYLVEVVGCILDTLWNHSYKGKLLAIHRYHIMKKFVKDAPYALYVSEEFLQHRYPCSGRSIGCSDVILPPLCDTMLERRLNKIYQMSHSKTIVLGTAAAVNVKYKGQEYVIKAISKLNKEGYNFEYHLVGGGDNTYLKNVAKKYNVVDKVNFYGSIPHAQVFEFMKNIDIYIQPSNAESHGRVIIEAMSTACPIIGSSTGGIPELVSPEFVFKRKDVNDLIVKIKKMTKEKGLLEAKRNFEKAKEFDKTVLDRKRNKF